MTRIGLKLALAIFLFSATSFAAPTETATTQPTTQPTAVEQLVLDMIQWTNDVTAILKEVNDAETAQTAVPKLDAYAPRIRKLQQDMMALEPIDPAERQAALDKHAKAYMSAMNASQAEMERIRKSSSLNSILEKPLSSLAVFGASSEASK